MHTAHCARHITLCQKCDEPVPKREFENHKCDNQVESTPEPLPPPPSKPKVSEVPSQILARAKPAKPSIPVVQNPVVYDSICQFCKLEFPQRELSEHENYCGSRTEQCPECQDFVMLREWDKHQSMRLYHGKYCSLFFRNEIIGK